MRSRTHGVLLSLFFAACMTGAVVAEPEPRVSNAVSREQTLRFAPIVSMRNELTLGANAPTRAADVLAQWIKDRDEAGPGGAPDMDSDILTAQRDMRAFFAGPATGRAEAAIRNLDGVKAAAFIAGAVDEPELGVAAAIATMFAQAAKNDAVASWWAAYDKRARINAIRIRPIIKSTALGRPTKDDSIVIRHTLLRDPDTVALQAVNNSHKPLRNVAMYVVLESLDGQTCEHFYFRPAWDREDGRPAGDVYTLRLAGDWAHIGAGGTVAARVSVYSDEIVAENVRCSIDDNIPIAADQLLDQAEQQVRDGRKLKPLYETLDRVRPKVVSYADRTARLDGVREAARTAFGNRVAELNADIIKANAAIGAIDDALKPSKRPRNIPKLYEERAKAVKHHEALKLELVRLGRGEI